MRIFNNFLRIILGHCKTTYLEKKLFLLLEHYPISKYLFLSVSYQYGIFVIYSQHWLNGYNL